MEQDLVDEYRLLVFPTVLGAGRRLFTGPAGAADLRLASVEQSGVAALLRYERSGGRTFGGAVPNPGRVIHAGRRWNNPSVSGIGSTVHCRCPQVSWRFRRISIRAHRRSAWSRPRRPAHRVRLLIDITACAGSLSPGAAGSRRPAQPGRGGDHHRPGGRWVREVPQMRDLLRGGHVLVDDPQAPREVAFNLNESAADIQSSHGDIDKKPYPDFWMRGPADLAEAARPDCSSAPGCSSPTIWPRNRAGQAAEPGRPPPPHGLDVTDRITRSNAWSVGPVADDRAASDAPVA